MLNISGLNEGVVVDHIPAGGAMKIYEYLNMDKWDTQIAIIKNASSSKMGKKDIIKIEGSFPPILDMVGIIDENITFNIIKDDKIVEKRKVNIPNQVVNILKCKNPRCITSIEQELPQIFKLSDGDKKTYKCIYCEMKYKEKPSLG